MEIGFVWDEIGVCNEKTNSNGMFNRKVILDKLMAVLVQIKLCSLEYYTIDFVVYMFVYFSRSSPPKLTFLPFIFGFV